MSLGRSSPPAFLYDISSPARSPTRSLQLRMEQDLQDQTTKNEAHGADSCSSTLQIRHTSDLKDSTHDMRDNGREVGPWSQQMHDACERFGNTISERAITATELNFNISQAQKHNVGIVDFDNGLTVTMPRLNVCSGSLPGQSVLPLGNSRGSFGTNTKTSQTMTPVLKRHLPGIDRNNVACPRKLYRAVQSTTPTFDRRLAMQSATPLAFRPHSTRGPGIAQSTVARIDNASPDGKGNCPQDDKEQSNCDQVEQPAHDHPIRPPPKFHKFMELAPELRERIYAFALTSDRPILPHLCDDTLKFHDDNQQRHDATNALLGVTRVSKQIRNESLPVFYSANVFQIGSDTVTYFERLEHLDRFNMIRQVRFEIAMRREIRAAGILRAMNQYIKAATAYERSLCEKGTHDLSDEKHQTEAGVHVATTGDSDKECSAPGKIPDTDHVDGVGMVGKSFDSLIGHPQYEAGGIEELTTLITMRKLTSTFVSRSGNPSPEYTTQLVIPVPRAAIFTEYESLKWFPIVCHGLGIHVRFVENVKLACAESGSITVIWHQKYQKKDFHETNVGCSAKDGNGEDFDGNGQTEVYRRALKRFPDLETLPRPTRITYYRRSCKKDHIRWYSVTTEGGGIPV